MTGPVSAPAYAEVPPAVLVVWDHLHRWQQLTTRLGGSERVTLRKPDDLSQMWVLVRTAGGFALDASRGAWSRTVQAEVCATRPVGVSKELPELATERVAALIATHLDDTRAQVFQGASWRARYLDGPTDLTDTSRGADSPVYRQVVRFDVRLHAHV